MFPAPSGKVSGRSRKDSPGDLCPEEQRCSTLPGTLEGCQILQEQAVAQETRRYERWLAALDAFGVQFLVLDTELDGGLVQAARSHPGWDVDLEDGGAVLFARAGMPGKAKGAT